MCSGGRKVVGHFLYEMAINSLGGGVQNPHGMSPSLNLTRHYPACVFTHFGGDPDVTFEPPFDPDLDSLGSPATFLGTLLHHMLHCINSVYAHIFEQFTFCCLL